MKYPCPVCGYPNLDEPPEDFTICPCCGVEFGNDDVEASPVELRHHWLSAGAQWFSHFTPPPIGWHPLRQLLKSGLALDLRALGVDMQPGPVSLEPRPVFLGTVQPITVAPGITGVSGWSQVSLKVAG